MCASTSCLALQQLGELEKGIEDLHEAERLARTLDDRRRLGWISVYLGLSGWCDG